MAVPGFTLGALILLLHISSVANYPNGKVTKSCYGMIPEHGHTPQSDPVHHISVSQMTFRPGDQLKGTVLGLTICILSFPLLLYIESLLLLDLYIHLNLFTYFHKIPSSCTSHFVFNCYR